METGKTITTITVVPEVEPIPGRVPAPAPAEPAVTPVEEPVAA